MTRWLVIYDGLRSVEQSKIYIDLEGLRYHLHQKIGPEFDRMLALRRETAVLGDAKKSLALEISKYRDDDIIGEMLLHFAEDDPAQILQKVVQVVWAEYASNSHFGLDVYLSTRIRHGTLKGHLRSQLEESHLICQLGGATYKDQAYWADRLDEISDGQEPWLQTALKNFSAKIDADIAHLNGEALRLRTATNLKGWFDLEPRPIDVLSVDRFLSEHDVSLDELITALFAYLNRRLEKILAYVRLELPEEYRQRWTAELRILREGVVHCGSAQLRSEVEAAIATATVAVDLAFERVGNWFTLSAARLNPDYGLDLAIEIAGKSIDNCFGSKVLSVDLEAVNGPVFQGRTLASLVDMFFIVFENIIKHARHRSDEDAGRAEVRLSRSGEIILISIKNGLPADTDIIALLHRIRSIKASLAEEGVERLAIEGGSGFHKLRKILASDLGLTHDFDFGVIDQEFEVVIMLDAARVSA